MPIIHPPAPYLNPYRCDDCGRGIGSDGLVEIGSRRVGDGPPEPVVGDCLCAACLDVDIAREGH